MQVMSIGNAAAELEAPTPAASAPEAAAGGFATMLAMLLAADGVGAPPPVVDAEVTDVEAPDTVEETRATDAAESEEALGVLASAMATPMPAAPTLPAAPQAGSNPMVPLEVSANVEALSPTPTTSVTIEPPEEQRSGETASPPVAATATGADTEPMVEVPVSPAPAAARSHATHTVVPHPARAAEEVALAPVVQEVPAAPASTQADSAALAAPAAETAPVAATLAAAPQTLARATVSTASVLGRDVVAVDEADTDADVEAPANVPRAAMANAAAAAEDVEAAEPPAPAPVLERNTVVLARNALNDQVRESSSRELLASARDPEPRAEKTTEAATPPLLPGTEAGVRSLPRHAVTAAHATTGQTHADVPTTLPTLGEDLVKHVTLSSSPGERTLTLRLQPETLGEVRVEVRSTAGEVSVRIVSQDASVREVLEHHAAGLREALSKDGRETRIEIGSQLMSNMGNSSDSTWGQRQANPQDLTERPRFTAQLNYGASTPEPVAQAERRAPQHAGLLNLFA